MTSYEGHQEASAQAVAREFEEFGFSLWRMSNTTSDFSHWVARNSGTKSCCSRQGSVHSTVQGWAGTAPSPLFALCRPCSKFKQQFNNMVNTEARQSLGVGLGHPKLRFSIQN